MCLDLKSEIQQTLATGAYDRYAEESNMWAFK